MKSDGRKYKIAFISAVPFYYQVPLYKSLSNNPQIDMMVYFCSDETISGSYIEKTYGKKAYFTKDNLLEGYRFKFLKNYSFTPSFLKKGIGLVNIGVWREIQSNKYDAVVLQAWNNTTWIIAFFACLFFRVKIFFMTDSNILEERFKSSIQKLSRKIFLGGLIFPFAEGFLTSGASNEEFYRFYGVPSRKLMRFPFSWGYQEIIQKGKKLLPKSELRQSLGFQKDDFIVLYAGRLSKEKNITVLIEAFSKVVNLKKKLCIVGDGPERTGIEKFAKENNIEIIITGFKERESVFSFYASADVLVLPSLRETWGIVVAEAMCFGLPVIVSDRVGSSLDLVHAGCNGYIFKAGDVKDLSERIESIMSLSKEKMQSFRKEALESIQQWANDSSLWFLNILKLLK